jgi:3-oxoacyl-[acyl-carrier protein] reductase/meso-butanediol dehydrogenase/(S,S)-butanediol dehydrogenase/diacetyl reductase
MIGARNDNGLAKELGASAQFKAVDVCKPSEHRTLVQAALDWRGRLDCFVNSAGLSAWRPLAKVDEEFWHRMVDTNLKGTFFGCQAAAASLEQGGCIINVSSLAGKRGSTNNSVYCASKFGVNGITQALAKELGPRGIRVNAVCPVYVRTEGVLEALAEDDAPPSGKDVDTYLADFIKLNSALGTLPTADQVASVCLFLASPAASAITGQCINVDCGVLPQ